MRRRRAAAAGLLAAALPAAAGLVATLGRYPTYGGTLDVSGTVSVEATGGDPGLLSVAWDIAGADAGCTAAANNACGVHVHQGTDCGSDAGPHFFAGGADPWPFVRYQAGLGGSGADEARSDQRWGKSLYPVRVGYDLAQLDGHTIVVHDATGARVACGVINSSANPDPVDPSPTWNSDWAQDWWQRSNASVVSFVPYVNYSGLAVSGKLDITSIGGNFTSQTNTPGDQPLFGSSRAVYGQYQLDPMWLLYTWNLQGVDSSCTAATVNRCGVHIHEGNTCATAGGHFINDTWRDSYAPILDAPELDTWLPVQYSGETASSSAQLRIGHGVEDASGRTIVVHDATGARVACGVLGTEPPSNATGTPAPPAATPGPPAATPGPGPAGSAPDDGGLDNSAVAAIILVCLFAFAGTAYAGFVYMSRRQAKRPGSEGYELGGEYASAQ